MTTAILRIGETGAISHAVVHTSADEDLGTYDQPGTMAADKHFLPPGTKVWLACDATTSWKTPAWNAPRIGCARSHMLTLYVAGSGERLAECEDRLTMKATKIIVSPPAGLPVKQGSACD
jgi:hypothetical protein